MIGTRLLLGFERFLGFLTLLPWILTIWIGHSVIIHPPCSKSVQIFSKITTSSLTGSTQTFFFQIGNYWKARIFSSWSTTENTGHQLLKPTTENLQNPKRSSINPPKNRAPTARDFHCNTCNRSVRRRRENFVAICVQVCGFDIQNMSFLNWIPKKSRLWRTVFPTNYRNQLLKILKPPTTEIFQNANYWNQLLKIGEITNYWISSWQLLKNARNHQLLKPTTKKPQNHQLLI